MSDMTRCNYSMPIFRGDGREQLQAELEEKMSGYLKELGHE
jgi:hypothetical protein